LQITKCWQTHTPVPHNIIEWPEAAHQFENGEEAVAERLSQISSQLCNLRTLSTQINGSPSPYGFPDSKKVIANALEIDNELAVWATTCSPAYRYRTVTVEEKSEDLYFDYYHIYSCISSATVWNDYRVVRILVNELLLQHSRKIMQEEFESTDAETLSSFLYQLVHDSASITVQLAGDICSTVPFCLGFSLKNSQAPKMKHFPKAITGCHLVWPLYIATRTEFGPEMREWAISRLRGISENMGIKQAMVVADCVANNEDFLS
jgi:hypothetical protein